MEEIQISNDELVKIIKIVSNRLLIQIYDCSVQLIEQRIYYLSKS